MNNGESEAIINEVVSKLVWKGVGGLLAVLAITITVASLIAEKGDPGPPPTKVELQELIDAQMKNIPRMVIPLLQDDLTRFESLLSEKINDLKLWDDESTTRTDWVSVTRADYGAICPRHMYVIGVEFKGKPTGDAIGSPIAVRLVCQALNTPKD